VGEKQQPDWVRTAKLRPVLKETGDQSIALLPDDPEGFIAKWKNRNRNQGDPSEPSAAPTGPAPVPPANTGPANGQKKTDNGTAPLYKQAEQQTLQQLVTGAAASGTLPKR
jgi:membrane protein required for colicin V production